MPSGAYGGLTSAVDVMPTVLDLVGMEIPAFVQGRSLARRMQDPSLPGREFVVSSIPFANPGDPVNAVDNFLRTLAEHPVTTVTAGEWSLLYCPEAGYSQLYNLATDPAQEHNLIETNPTEARSFIAFSCSSCAETKVPNRLLKPRLKLQL